MDNISPYPGRFPGTLEKMQLTSNRFGYGPRPELGEEIEQRLTITLDGRVFFSSYGYGPGETYVKIRSRRFKIGSDATKHILQLLQDCFSGTRVVPEVTDVGDWTATFSSAGRKAFRCGGPLCPVDPALSSISGIMRYHLKMPDLLAFDGETSSDRIEKVTIDYHRVTKIKPSVIPEGVDWEYATWDYSERLIIDRTAETLEHIQNIGSECRVFRTYHVQEGISSLLDEFDASGFLRHVQGNPPDAMGSPLETKDYSIVVECLYGGKRTISGTFDRDGLPSDFPEFIEAVFDFTRFYGVGELFEPSIYTRPLRKPTDLIFCYVEFEGGGERYCYLTEDEGLREGDIVTVPVGADDREVRARVMGIEYHGKMDAPYPLDKIKKVLRRIAD